MLRDYKTFLLEQQQEERLAGITVLLRPHEKEEKRSGEEKEIEDKVIITIHLCTYT